MRKPSSESSDSLSQLKIQCTDTVIAKSVRHDTVIAKSVRHDHARSRKSIRTAVANDRGNNFSERYADCKQRKDY